MATRISRIAPLHHECHLGLLFF